VKKLNCPKCRTTLIFEKDPQIDDEIVCECGVTLCVKKIKRRLSLRGKKIKSNSWMETRRGQLKVF
jgi:hypothetical protein